MNRESMTKYLRVRNGTDPLVLADLATSPDQVVRIAVARNPHTPVDVLMALAHDPVVKVRDEVAANPSLSVEAMLYLAEPGRDWNLRWGILCRPSLPADVMGLLAKEDMDIRCCVATRHDVPVDLLRRFAKDRSVAVRNNVTTNSSCPLDVLMDLTRDRHEFVRQAAWEAIEERGLIGLLGVD